MQKSSDAELNLQMYTFISKKIADITLELPDRIATNCHEYTLYRESLHAGKLYGGTNFSFIEYENNLVRIDRNAGFFQKTSYDLFDHRTGSYMGSFKFSNNLKKCTLTLEAGSIFHFHKDSSGKVFYRPSTWNKFRHEMNSEKDMIVYSGRSSDLDIYEGTIETTNETLLLPMLAGIYIIEERLRMLREFSG